MSKIVRLQAENIKRLKAVKITPDGNVCVVGGANGAGKSSVLDSIMYALAGGKNIPSKPLRNGTKKGTVRLDIAGTEHGDLVVERTFTEKGSTLVIKTKDGYEAPTPQSILDAMCGKLAFDPLAFAREKPKDQLATLRELVSVDLSALDNERQSVFATRTSINRDAKQLEGELAGLTLHENAPDAEVSVADLTEKLEEIRSINHENDLARMDLRNCRDALAETQEDAKAITEQIAELKEQLAKMEKRIAEETKTIAAKSACVEKLVDADPAPVREQIRTAESTNAMVRANARRAEVDAKLSKVRDKSKALTERLEAIDAEKAAAVAAAKFPVAGLGLSEDGVTLNGVPFEQASSSERIRVSAAMGLAMNPDLRVMLIRDGSLLDESGLAVLGEMAESSDAQIWIERVSVGDEVSVVIEDGSVKEDRTVERETAEVAG